MLALAFRFIFPSRDWSHYEYAGSIYGKLIGVMMTALVLFMVVLCYFALSLCCFVFCKIFDPSSSFLTNKTHRY